MGVETSGEKKVGEKVFCSSLSSRTFSLFQNLLSLPEISLLSLSELSSSLRSFVHWKTIDREKKDWKEKLREKNQVFLLPALNNWLVVQIL